MAARIRVLTVQRAIITEGTQYSKVQVCQCSRHVVVAAASPLLCENEHRQALETKSERNALALDGGERRR